MAVAKQNYRCAGCGIRTDPGECWDPEGGEELVNKWEDAEWVGGDRAQHKVTGAMLCCLFPLCLHFAVHHLQRSHLPQKIMELVEAKSSQPALQRVFQMLTILRQSHLLGS